LVKVDSSGSKYTLQLDFMGKHAGQVEDPYLTLNGYQIKTVTVNLDRYEGKVSAGTFKAFKLTAMRGSFNGMLQKLNKIGFPEKPQIPFEGTIEK